MQGPGTVEVKSRLGLAVLFSSAWIDMLGAARHGLPPIDQMAVRVPSYGRGLGPRPTASQPLFFSSADLG